MYLVQIGYYPSKLWLHDPKLQDINGNTVAMMFAIRGIIPPPEWKYNEQIRNNFNEDVKSILQKREYTIPKELKTDIQKLQQQNRQEKDNSKNSKKKKSLQQQKRRKWTIEEHRCLLLKVQQFGKNNIDKITDELNVELRAHGKEERDKGQVRSHLQKYYKRLDQGQNDISLKLQQDTHLTNFFVKFNKLNSEEEKFKALKEYLQQFKQKYFMYKKQIQIYPLSLQILYQGIVQLREMYPEIPKFEDEDNYLNDENAILILKAIQGEYDYQDQYTKSQIFIYIDYQKSNELEIKRVRQNFDVCKSQVSQMAQQQKHGLNYSFNCNFLLKYCYKILETSLGKSATFVSIIQKVLYIQRQIQDVGDTFEYAIKQQTSSDKESQETKLFMVCLRCMLSYSYFM